MKTLEYLKQTLPCPDNTFRPVQIVHCYYPKTAAETERYLDTAIANGIGGFVVNVDCVPARLDGESEKDYKLRRLDGYLGEGTPETDAAWDALKAFIDACFVRGLKVWIYDELAYPSGAAGNKVLKDHPEDQIKGLVCAASVVEGGSGCIDGETGTLVSASACPLDENGVMLTGETLPVTEKDGKLYFDLPAGKTYRVYGCYVRPIAFLTENKVPVADLMRADVVDRYIDVTHDAYRRHLGEETIAKITAFFTDEPGLPTHGCSSYFYEKNAVAAWTEEMENLLPGIRERYADLFFFTDRDYAGLRRQYWQTAAELYAENYFGRIAAWCEKYGTRMTGHLYGEETLSMQIGLNADLFGLMRYMQMPGVDRLYCVNPRDVTAEKTASSAAHLYGREFTMSENSFHLEHNWWKTPEEATAENRMNSMFYQIQLGISHCASYFPNPGQPDAERKLYQAASARAALFCGTGTHKTDILVLIPMGAAYERFMPPDHKYWDVGPCIVAPYQDKSVQILEEAYGEVLLQLEDSRFDFDLIDDKGLLECTAVDGKLTTPYESFRHLVLFDSGAYPAEVLAKVEAFLSCGGTVTAVRTDLSCAGLASLAEKYPGSVRFCAWQEIAGTVQAAPVLDLAENCPNVRVKRTETEDAVLWFVHNRGEECTVTVREAGTITVFDPADGQGNMVQSDGAFDLTLPAKSARMLVKEK